MTPDRQALVRDSWRVIAPDAVAVAPSFYERLFELNPDARALFAHADMPTQHRRVMEMLDAIVESLDSEEAFVSGLATLGRRHVRYGAEDGHYDSVGAALLHTLETALGDRWTPEVADAWAEAYRLMAGVMRRAAQRERA